ncbi:MAG TPA: BACON domain-containing carbohydrate-binding protein [Ktedonobacteraceae bacterium]|nr:BACON domain-containing carbohydrate-binding protein [Ktedonobacteraceae bacterium]
MKQSYSITPYLVDEQPEANAVAGRDDIPNRITTPLPIASANPTPLPEELNAPAHQMEQALYQLNDAAQRIAFVEQQERKDRRRPRASRLAPLRDISAEIQRDSTPLLPRTAYSTQHLPEEQSAIKEAKGDNLPDFWPWLDNSNDDDAETSEVSNDSWSNRTDPLLFRRLPFPSHAQQTQQTQPAQIESQSTRPLPVPSQKFVRLPSIAVRLIYPPDTQQQHTWLRPIFICLALLAALVLIVDGFLAATLLLPQGNKTAASSPPTLLLSTNVVQYGQSVAVGLRHFSPSALVLLTHNVGESVKLNTGNPRVQVGKDGSADVTLYIENSWNPGVQTIEAEDINTRYTASATLQLDAGTAHPAQLEINPTQLDLGAAIQGANSIHAITLHNTGGSTISWSASSDQSWLQLTPNQGSFSDNQTILVGVQRTNLKPGAYTGKITFASNVGNPQFLQVQMAVNPLPGNPGAVLTVTPAVLTFTAIDSGSDPASQLLQVNNPGTQPLYWSIDNNAQPSSSQLPASIDRGANWLSTDSTKDTVPPGGTGFVRVFAHSHKLLPGAYLSTLTISSQTGNTVLNSPQTVAISLTVQPSCSVMLSRANLSFTAVSGQNAPGNQALNLTGTNSCAGAVSWNAASSASWLTITPRTGLLRGGANEVTTVGVNTNGLKPGIYTGDISITAAQSTQMAIVQLSVQDMPSLSSPIIGASPLNLNFSTTLGHTNPPGQIVTITNTGGGPLLLHTSVNAQSISWLSVSSQGGTIAPGQTQQLTVNVNANTLAPGNYEGQVVLSGSDSNNVPASGSPQTITVNLVVQPPCTLAQPSSSSLAFSAPQGSTDPTPQAITITASGNCSWPLNWKATMTSSASWLKLSPASGTLSASGQSATLNIAPSIAGLTPGNYSAQVSIAASDTVGQVARSSPQVFTITLTVQQPCSLQVATSGLSFSAIEGQTTSAQNLSFSETGSCSFPVAWSATGDSGSSDWLVLSATSGKDSGNGVSISVSANASNLSPGTYKGTITISANDSSSTTQVSPKFAAAANISSTFQGSPQSVTVTLTVKGFTVNGTVNACSSSTCSTSTPLSGATVNIVDSGGNTVASTVTDSSGNFSLSSIPAGSYTISAAGSDSAKKNYVGSTTVTISSNQQSVTVNVLPTSSQ